MLDLLVKSSGRAAPGFQLHCAHHLVTSNVLPFSEKMKPVWYFPRCPVLLPGQGMC